MSLPCNAQATYFEDGGGVLAGPFNFERQGDTSLYQEVGGGSRIIIWNAVDNWVFTDDNRSVERDGVPNEDDPAGDYTYSELDYAGNDVIYTITVTTSGSSCSSDSDSDSDSDSGSDSGSDSDSESSSSSSSGSEKSFSSVSESEAQP